MAVSLPMQFLMVGAMAGLLAHPPAALAQQEGDDDATAPQLPEEQEPGIEVPSPDPRIESD